ncbi:MAG: enoyl-CoA hydratase/isomerase family protein [Myxococcales bacterium]|nr:enoyl-CoA hydratase/isomerase family protein [Myxococcales bacterium]
MSESQQALDGDPHVLYGAEEGVATITLDRPEKLNAVTFSMQTAFAKALDRAEADASLHAVVIRGNGRAFCAGVDLEDMARHHGEFGHEADAARIRAAALHWTKLWNLRKPVIVRAHGHCVGWGLEIALNADIVLASEECRFHFPSIRIGTGLPDSAMAIYHLGLQWAKRMLLTGDAIDGRTAERIGLALMALPEARLDDEVEILTRSLCEVPVDLLAESKAVLNRAVELMGRTQLQEFSEISNATARRDPRVDAWNRSVTSQGSRATRDSDQA